MAAVTVDQLTALRGVVSPTDAVEEILCSQPKTDKMYLFAVVRVKSGAICAVWEKHASAFVNEEELLSAEKDKGLNVHEKTLYALKAQVA